MRGIPEDRLKTAERRLRERLTAMEAARAAYADALDDATSLTGPLANTDGGSRGGRVSDRTARGADRLAAAREHLQTVEAWEAVFTRVERDFPPASPEGKVMALCLVAFRADGAKWAAPVMTLADLARAEGVDRQTIARRKEIILDRVAYYAAEAGLTNGEE